MSLLRWPYFMFVMVGISIGCTSQKPQPVPAAAPDAPAQSPWSPSVPPESQQQTDKSVPQQLELSDPLVQADTKPESPVDSDDITLSPQEKVLSALARKALDAKLEQLVATTNALRIAMIHCDDEHADELRQTAEEQRHEIRKTLEQPINAGTISIFRLAQGQVGRISTGGLRVFQVIDQKTGTMLIRTPARRDDLGLIRVVGVDASNLTDGARFTSNDLFVVVGTHTYETASGGTRTVFELHRLTTDKFRLFPPGDLKRMSQVIEESLEIRLTDAERTVMEGNRKQKKERQKEEQQKMMAAKAAADQAAQEKKHELRLHASQAYLDMGKKLLKKNNYSGARKYFEKSIAEAPESDSAKEANKLLDELPAF